MSLRKFAAGAPAQGQRRIDYDSCEVVGNFPGGEILVVRGQAPCLNMDVDLTPLVYIDCPEYWEIEVLGALRGGFCLRGLKPFTLAIPLAGITGYRGIEVLGARRSETIEVAGGCRQGRSLDQAEDEDAAGSDAAGGDAAAGECRFRNWQAIADFMPGVDPKPLRVGGEFRLNRRSGTARLVERQPPGTQPSELTLDVVIDGPGLGGDWVRLEDSYAAREGQYRTARIFDPNGGSIQVEVQEVH